RFVGHLPRTAPRRQARTGRGGGRATTPPGQPSGQPAALPQGQAFPQGQGPPGGPGGFGQSVALGMYRVVLTVDGKELIQNVRVEADPTLPATILAGDGETNTDPPSNNR